MKRIAFLCGLLCSNLFGLSIDDVEKAAKQEDYSNMDANKTLYLYVGIDYIPQEMIKLFEQVSGIKVVICIFDSNEILEAKMLAGGAQYDLVFPTAFPCFSRQLRTGIYQKIDKTLLDTTKYDGYVMSKLRSFDYTNEYCVPYQWGISGIGIRSDIIKKELPDVQLNSYALIFNEENIKKLAKYGVSFYESHEELFPAVAAYLGEDPENINSESVKRIAQHLKKIRNYIRKFTGYGFEDLASGSACIILGTSGDITCVQKQEIANYGHSSIKFVFPREGASLWIDVAAIPKEAKHVKNAHLFLKFLMNPYVSAYISNSTYRATAIPEARKYMDKDLAENEFIYPTEYIQSKCYVEKYTSGSINKLKTKTFTKIKSSRVL